MFSFKSSKDNDSETKFRVVPTVVHGHTFTLSTRYSLADSKVLGRGSFGVVVTAQDSVTGRTVAIKRIRPYANDDWDGRHTLREIRLLRLLGNHPNIITLHDLSLYEEKTELYMMLELMDCDLHRVIQSKQALTMKHNKCFIRQIIEGIKAMHEIGVFHRDLKPGNILVSKDCQVRITDFGLARYMHESTRQGNNALNPMTEYVVTRWYRCPELLLAPNRPYDEAIDMWSIGCILAELLKRKPLFPGKSHPNQVQLIFEVFGYSDRSELGFEISAEAALFMDKKCRYRKQSLRSVIPEADDQAMELLEALLAINPSKRPTAQQSLQFAFNTDADVLYDYSKSYLKPPSQNFFDFEHETYDISQLRQMIHDEVDLYKRIDGGDKSTQAATNNNNNNNSSNKKSPRPASGDSSNGDKSANQNKIEPQATSRQDDGPSSQMATMPRGGHNPNNNNNNNVNTNNTISRNVSNTTIPSNNNSNASRPPVPNASIANNSSKANPFASSSTSQKSQQSSNVSQTVGGVLAYARNLNASSPAPRTPKTPTQQQMQTIINKDTKLKHRMLIQKTDNAVPQPRQLQPLPSNYVSIAHSSSTSQMDNAAAADNKSRIPPITNNSASKSNNSSRQGISSILSHLHSKYQSLSARDEINQVTAASKQGARKVATAPDHASRADSSGNEKQAAKKSSFIPFPSLRR